MEPKELGLAWRELSEEAISGIIEWRLRHPKATFAEIETELDLRLAGLRARMLPGYGAGQRQCRLERKAAGRKAGVSPLRPGTGVRRQEAEAVANPGETGG